jgi:hypothetical protein
MKRNLPAIIPDQALAEDITTRWVAAVRNRFDAAFSREWLETALRRELRECDSLPFVIKVVESAWQGDEIADAALRDVATELQIALFQKRDLAPGHLQIIAYLQRVSSLPPHQRGRGNAWYDDYSRNIGNCTLIKLAVLIFGVSATRSLESRRPNRPPSGVSLITDALARNGVFISETTVQKKLWFGYLGYLVRTVDHPTTPEFLTLWALAAPFLKDLQHR